MVIVARRTAPDLLSVHFTRSFLPLPLILQDRSFAFLSVSAGVELPPPPDVVPPPVVPGGVGGGGVVHAKMRTSSSAQPRSPTVASVPMRNRKRTDLPRSDVRFARLEM